MRATIHLPTLTLRDAKPGDLFILNAEGSAPGVVFALARTALRPMSPMSRCLRIVVIASNEPPTSTRHFVGTVLLASETASITLLEQIERVAFRQRRLPGDTALTPLEREELQKQLAHLRADIESTESQPPGAPPCAIRDVAVDEVPTATDPPSRL